MKETTISISVIMGIYGQNNYRQLRTAVLSILNQSIKDIELIIYMDGKDDSLKQELLSISKEDERVIIIGEDNNRGHAYALNRCLERARGVYIARMDSDDYSAPNRFKIQKKFLDNNEYYGFCGSNARLFSESGVWGKRYMKRIPAREDFLDYSPYIHPSIIFRKSVLEAVNGYNEAEEVRRCEDYDLFFRLYINGIKGYNVQEFLLWYREDYNNLKKRKYRYRVDEYRLRKKYFKKLGMWNAKGVFYALKPLLVGIIPTALMNSYKRRRNGYDRED